MQQLLLFLAFYEGMKVNMTKSTFVNVFQQAEEMAQTFRQRIAQAEAMARADILRIQPEVLGCFSSILTPFKSRQGT